MNMLISQEVDIFSRYIDFYVFPEKVTEQMLNPWDSTIWDLEKTKKTMRR